MRGLPLMVAAQVLGHSDTRMVEKHYGHLAKNYVSDAIELTTITLPDEPGQKASSGWPDERRSFEHLAMHEATRDLTGL